MLSMFWKNARKKGEKRYKTVTEAVPFQNTNTIVFSITNANTKILLQYVQICTSNMYHLGVNKVQICTI